MDVLLMTLPPGARLPTGKQTVEVRPRERAPSGLMMTSSGSMPSRSRSVWRRAARRSLCCHQSSRSPSLAPVTVVTEVSSRPARRRCSITSGTPPAMKTCTVGWLRGPLGSESTMRGTWRLTRAQSWRAGRLSPAEKATAERCMIRLVEQPKAACSTRPFSIERGVRMSASVRPASSWVRRARAARRAMSSQTGWPEGDSAACGTVRPSASPITCELAAVPRNWQPPPGEAQVWQSTSAAYSSDTSPTA